MRVRIIFKLINKGSHLPFHHQHILAQYLKGLLLEGGHMDYALYDNFNFSALKGQTRISRNGLHYYSNLVTLVVSADSQGFIDYLLEQIFKLKQVYLGELNVSPLYTEVENTPEFSEEMKFLCISPIVPVRASFIDPAGKRFITPEDDEFSDLLYESTLQRMEQSGQFDSASFEKFRKFQLVPDQEYLNRLKERDKKFARIYTLYDQDVKYEVRGYTFPFKLYAATEVQEFLFNCGIGNYTYKGFGMLDIANSNPIERAERYSFKKEMIEEA